VLLAVIVLGSGSRILEGSGSSRPFVPEVLKAHEPGEHGVVSMQVELVMRSTHGNVSLSTWWLAVIAR
jgi:hypothetical protein